jgi:hypothetical protein
MNLQATLDLHGGGPGSGRHTSFNRGLNKWRSSEKEREAARKDPKQRSLFKTTQESYPSRRSVTQDPMYKPWGGVFDKKLTAGGPGSGRRGEARTEEQRKAIYQSVPKTYSPKEALNREQWVKDAEEMGGVPFVEAGEEQIENESGPISRKLGKEIVQVGTNYCVRGQEPDVNLGCYNSRQQAETVMRGGSFIEPDVDAAGNLPQTGWQYGRKTTPVGYIPQRTLSGYPARKGKGIGTSKPPAQPKPHMSPNYPDRAKLPQAQHIKVNHPPKPPQIVKAKLPKAPKVPTATPRLGADADYGEPNAGAYQHAHLDTNLWFHPPSERNPKRIPTDDPGETDDKFLDVTKRNSKDTKEQRMKILKRSAPGGLPAQIPAHTTLISPHSAVYVPGMFGQAIRTRPVLSGRPRLRSKSY